MLYLDFYPPHTLGMDYDFILFLYAEVVSYECGVWDDLSMNKVKWD